MALIFSIASIKYLSAAFQLKYSYKITVDILETILVILLFKYGTYRLCLLYIF